MYSHAAPRKERNCVLMTSPTLMDGVSETVFVAILLLVVLSDFFPRSHRHDSQPSQQATDILLQSRPQRESGGL